MFPWIQLETLDLLGSGWEFDAYRSGRWVIRFPRRAEAAELFEIERPILELVRSVLPSSVRVPEVIVAGRSVEGFPYVTAAHSYIEGVPADRIDSRLRPHLARSLGRALAAVHGIPEVPARAAGLQELDRAEEGRGEWLRLGTAGASALRASVHDLDRALDWLASLSNPLRRLDAPLRVIHHDLSPEHLLVDSTTGDLVGILDWTDAILGDAARDFVPLVAFGGWNFVDEVLGHYAHESDPGFRERLRFMSRLLPLMWLGHARLRGEDVSRHAEWVRHAFADQSAS